MGRQGLNALIGVSGLQPDRIKASHIGFMLGPRLNAAGRLESALDALKLLTTEDINIAGKLAQKLDNQNQARQKLTQEIQISAERLAFARESDPLLLFAAHEGFNPGIIGLAASKLTENIIGLRSSHKLGQARPGPHAGVSQNSTSPMR
jgi:single-stranded-DNA-specific exonuclease